MENNNTKVVDTAGNQSLAFQFTDLVRTAIPPTRKNGRTRYEHANIITSDTLQPALLNPFKRGEQLYVRHSKVEYAKARPESRHYLILYKADGKDAVGLWKHGRHGNKIHREPVVVEHEEGRLRLVQISAYASGQIKDQRKYLLDII